MVKVRCLNNIRKAKEMTAMSCLGFLIIEIFVIKGIKIVAMILLIET